MTGHAWAPLARCQVHPLHCCTLLIEGWAFVACIHAVSSVTDVYGNVTRSRRVRRKVEVLATITHKDLSWPDPPESATTTATSSEHISEIDPSIAYTLAPRHILYRPQCAR